MITSGLVVQNYGKGTFPSSRKSHRVFVRPYTDNFDTPIPTFSRPFDEQFVNTIDYRKVFGRGSTADEKLYYLEHDMYQKIRKVNALPLNRRTRSKIQKALQGGTMMDKFLFLEQMFKNRDGEERSMSGIQGWIAGGMRQPGGELYSSDGTMSLDTRSILRSPSESIMDLENYQRMNISNRNSVTSELLDSGDLGSIINLLNLTDFDPATDDLIGDVIYAEGDNLPQYEPREEEEEDVDMPPEYASRRSSLASVPVANAQMNNILNTTEEFQSILGRRRRSSGQSDLPPPTRVRRNSWTGPYGKIRKRDSVESISDKRPEKIQRTD